MPLIFTFLLMLSSLTVSASLESHQWKERIILLFSEDDHRASFSKHEAEIQDRDLIYYHFYKGKLLTNAPAETLTAETLQQVKDDYQKRGKVILIGKDGRIKMVSQVLNLPKIFSLIDTMPMRKKEMRDSS